MCPHANALRSAAKRLRRALAEAPDKQSASNSLRHGRGSLPYAIGLHQAT